MNQKQLTVVIIISVLLIGVYALTQIGEKRSIPQRDHFQTIQQMDAEVAGECTEKAAAYLEILRRHGYEDATIEMYFIDEKEAHALVRVDGILYDPSGSFSSILGEEAPSEWRFSHTVTEHEYESPQWTPKALFEIEGWQQ